MKTKDFTFRINFDNVGNVVGGELLPQTPTQEDAYSACDFEKLSEDEIEKIKKSPETYVIS